MADEPLPDNRIGRTPGGAPWRRRRGLAVVASLVAIGLGAYFGVSSCSGNSAPPAAAQKPTPTATPKPKPATPLGNPLTGIGTAGHVIAVKIDNVGAAQSEQAGLNSADLVYVIQVEGGLSRYLAVFDSKTAPRKVGPVRSARETDIALLASFGHVGLVYSGAILGLLAYLARANLQNISPATAGQLFSNGGSSPTYVDPAGVYSTYPNLALPPDLGFRFGAEPAGGQTAKSVTVSMPTASFTFTASGTRWLVSVDGAPAMTTDQGRDFSDNVIVQHVNVIRGKFTDHNAAQPANEVYSQTVGHGEADFYRDGKVWHGQWSKMTESAPTIYTVNGAPMRLMPGRTWIVLLGTGFIG